MEATSTRQLLDRFADAIEANGIAAVPAELMISLVDIARSVDASPVAVAVLVDPTEPDVVRDAPSAGSRSRSSVVRIAACRGTDPVGRVAPSAARLTGDKRQRPMTGEPWCTRRRHSPSVCAYRLVAATVPVPPESTRFSSSVTQARCPSIATAWLVRMN